MTSNTKKRPPIWFWITSVLALIWYLMDTSGFFMRTVGLESMLARMPEQQQNLYLSMPLWVNVVFAAEVFGGLLGSISLLLKKQVALIFFMLSITGVLAQTCYVYFMSDSIKVMGTPAIAMPMVAILISVGLIFFTTQAKAKHWIH